MPCVCVRIRTSSSCTTTCNCGESEFRISKPAWVILPAQVFLGVVPEAHGELVPRRALTTRTVRSFSVYHRNVIEGCTFRQSPQRCIRGYVNLVQRNALRVVGRNQGRVWRNRRQPGVGFGRVCTPGSWDASSTNEDSTPNPVNELIRSGRIYQEIFSTNGFSNARGFLRLMAVIGEKATLTRAT